MKPAFAALLLVLRPCCLAGTLRRPDSRRQLAEAIWDRNAALQPRRFRDTDTPFDPLAV
jgi:hypothetical protein